MPLHVSSTCAHHQEVKIALHSLWYHHTYRWPSGAREKIKTQIFRPIIFFLRKSRAVYEKTRKNILETGRLQMTIWRMRIACCITKAPNTHSEYVILIPFPQQQWLQERASLLRYTYSCIVCLVENSFNCLL